MTRGTAFDKAAEVPLQRVERPLEHVGHGHFL
jgi:hypothetical protein